MIEIHVGQDLLSLSSWEVHSIKENAHIFLITFSIIDLVSFWNVIQEHMDELKNQMIKWNEVRYFRNKSSSFQIYCNKGDWFQAMQMYKEAGIHGLKLNFYPIPWTQVSLAWLSNILSLCEMWLKLLLQVISQSCGIITTSWRILNFLCVFVLFICLIIIVANIWIQYWINYEKMNQMPLMTNI